MSNNLNQGASIEAELQPMGPTTGRANPSEPVEYVQTERGLERRHKGTAIDIEAAPLGENPFIAMDFAQAEERIAALYPNFGAPYGKAAPRYDSPAGPHAGRVEIWSERGLLCVFGLSGNARQRRRTIRQLKVDFIVKQTNDATGAVITR